MVFLQIFKIILALRLKIKPFGFTLQFDKLYILMRKPNQQKKQQFEGVP